ncbi:MAG: hypothetical protein ACP6IU_11235 [Candidatus Asgardarchaeia archaeon]
MAKTHLLETFKCPECKVAVTDIYIDKDEIIDLYEKTSRPVPVPVACPNGHNLIVFLYINNGEIKIRTILPAAKAVKNGKINYDNIKKGKGKSGDKVLKWFSEW